MALSDPKKNTKPKIKAVINKLAGIVTDDPPRQRILTRQ